MQRCAKGKGLPAVGLARVRAGNRTVVTASQPRAAATVIALVSWPTLLSGVREGRGVYQWPPVMATVAPDREEGRERDACVGACCGAAPACCRPPLVWAESGEVATLRGIMEGHCQTRISPRPPCGEEDQPFAVCMTVTPSPAPRTARPSTSRSEARARSTRTAKHAGGASLQTARESMHAWCQRVGTEVAMRTHLSDRGDRSWRSVDLRRAPGGKRVSPTRGLHGPLVPQGGGRGGERQSLHVAGGRRGATRRRSSAS